VYKRVKRAYPEGVESEEMPEMSEFTVYQIKVDSAFGDLVNEYGWEEAQKHSPRVLPYLKSQMGEWKSEWFEQYNPVVRVEASDLEDVFAKLNYGGRAEDREDCVLTAPFYQKPRCMNVGDIIYSEDDRQFYFCKPVGFKPVAVF
jgi:hypothetical protein